MKTFAVVTTFHQDGYKKYGERMLKSFVKYWPDTIKIYAYYEGSIPEFQHPQIIYRELYGNCPELHEFKERHKTNLKAKGLLLDPTDKSSKPKWLGFKWDAVRFSHKSFAITNACMTNSEDVIIWLDADSHTHTKIDDSFLNKILPDGKYCGFLGREPNKYTETGFLCFDIKNIHNTDFMTRWSKLYIDDTIFSLPEWHDCECFDTVRRAMVKEGLIEQYNITDSIKPGIVLAHPFVNTFIGDYMDHLKGARKDTGSSRKGDLKIKKNHPYWNKVQ